MMKDREKTIGNLIDKSKLSIISYISEDGFPVSKAMLAPRERNGIREFWFSTNTSSNKVKAFRENPKASIYFVDRRFFVESACPVQWRFWKLLKRKNGYGEQGTRCIIMKV